MAELVTLTLYAPGPVRRTSLLWTAAARCSTRLVWEMYARGLSTRDVEDAFRDATGDMIISKFGSVGDYRPAMEDYQQFIARDLSDISVEYPFVDARL